MEVQILESDLEGVTFGKAISPWGDSLLFEVFVEADAVGIILMVYVGRVKDELPFFEDCMRYDLL
jgi:hypothetical protein